MSKLSGEKTNEQLEEELKEATARDEALFTTVYDGVVAMDSHGDITKMNIKAGEILGWSKNDILGENFIDYFKLSDEKGNPVPVEEHPFTKALTTAATTAFSSFYLKGNHGEKFPISLSVSTVMPAKKITGVISAFRDISQEKQIDKLRTDLLSLASHQLRTPLSGTKWLIETLRGKILGPVTQKQKEYLDEIYRLNERMIKLVFGILNTLQLEAGAAILKKETIVVRDFYEELFITMEPAAKSKEVTLRNLLANHKTVLVETDITMLRAILECFVSNAINYSMPGHEVILDAKEESTAVVFLVEDSGIGIPKDEQKRIFERFYRGSNAKRVRPDGTGLGLYISSMLAEKIGAEIVFESEEGKGSTVYLRIPKKSL